MAKYNKEEAQRLWAEKLVEATSENRDFTMLDMIGFFAWKKIASKKDKLTEEEKQLMFLGALFAAFQVGLSYNDGDEITQEFFEFIDSLEMTPGTKTEDLMGW